MPETGSLNGIAQEQINHLLETFRSGLRALIPIADTARIPWCEGEAYDDWDSLLRRKWRLCR